MSKSSESFRKRLKIAIDAKITSVTDIHKTTKIARNSIYGYLQGAVPDLDTVDKIAEALGFLPWDIIKPEDEVIIRPHLSIQDCIQRLAEAASGNEADFKIEVRRKETAEELLPPDIQTEYSMLKPESKKLAIAAFEYILSTLIKKDGGTTKRVSFKGDGSTLPPEIKKDVEKMLREFPISQIQLINEILTRKSSNTAKLDVIPSELSRKLEQLDEKKRSDLLDRWQNQVDLILQASSSKTNKKSS